MAAVFAVMAAAPAACLRDTACLQRFFSPVVSLLVGRRRRPNVTFRIGAINAIRIAHACIGFSAAGY